MPPSARNAGRCRLPITLPAMKKRERDQHPARAAADGVERAGAAAVGELHADAEHEGADDERRPDRRDRAAEARHERRDRHDGRGGDRDQQQAAEQAVGLAAHDQTPPRGGEAELGLEERDAEREAETPEARRTPAGRRSGRARPAPPAPAPRRSGTASRDAAGAPRRRIGRGDAHVQFCVGDFRRSANDALRAEAERLLQVVPLACARRQPDGSRRRSIRPSSRRRAARPAGRASPTARTSRSPPSGRCCNRPPPARPARVAAIAASCALRPQAVGRRIVEASRCRD